MTSATAEKRKNNPAANCQGLTYARFSNAPKDKSMYNAPTQTHVMIHVSLGLTRSPNPQPAIAATAPAPSWSALTPHPPLMHLLRMIPATKA